MAFSRRRCSSTVGPSDSSFRSSAPGYVVCSRPNAPAKCLFTGNAVRGSVVGCWHIAPNVLLTYLLIPSSVIAPHPRTFLEQPIKSRGSFAFLRAIPLCALFARGVNART